MSPVLGTLVACILFGAVMAWVLRPLNPDDMGPDAGMLPSQDPEKQDGTPASTEIEA